MAYTKEEIRAAGLHDFRVFLFHVWVYLQLPKPTPVQNDIAKYLQRGPNRRIIQAFRGVGKSWITVAYVLWRLFLDPDEKIMVVSANESLAHDFVKFCFQLINGMPLLQHLAPRPGQRASSEKFDVGPSKASKDPSLKSVGITGQLTGSRASLIVADDIEVPKNSYTHNLREKLAELVKEFDAVLMPGGDVVFLGTPQSEATVYTRLHRERGYSIRIWPVEIPQSVTRYAGNLAPFVLRLIERGAAVGSSIEPTRFSKYDLDARRLSYGRSGYALQFMLDPTPSDVDKHPLRLSDLVIADVDADLAPIKYVWGRDRESTIQDLTAGGFDGDVYYRPVWKAPEMEKFQGTVMAIDPSGRGKDETAYSIVRYLHGVLFLVKSGGFRDGYSDDTLESLANLAVRFKCSDVVIEENYGGGMFTKLFMPWLQRAAMKANKQATEEGALGDYWSPKVNDEEKWNGWSRGQKERRILGVLEPLIQGHKLVVDRRVIEDDVVQQAEDQQYSLVYQMTRLTKDKDCLAHDDRIEALSMACSFFTEQMDRDQDRARKTHRAKALEAELRRYKQHVMNPTGKPAQHGGGNRLRPSRRR